MSLYNIFLHLHSGFRYLVLLLVIVAILVAFAGWFGKRTYTNGNRKLNLFAMISLHTQFLFGIILYFVSPLVQFNSQTMKDGTLRYWTMEHVVLMLFAIALVTVGHARSKKIILHTEKHRVIAISYSLAVIIIVAAILQSQRPLIG